MLTVPAVDEHTSSTSAPTGDGCWVEQRCRAMGSPAHLIVGGGSNPADAAVRAIAELERLEQCWSRFRPDSELNRLLSSPGRAVTVGATLLRALVEARSLHVATGGIFDPTVRAALERLGYDRTFTSIDRGDVRGRDASSPLGRAGPVPGFERVMIDEARRQVTVPVGVGIDLGGIGKGLAADLVTDLLLADGVESVCLSLGGDVRVGGTPPDGAWQIPVEDPHREGTTLFTHPLADGAIVTSTVRFRRWQRDGGWHHHLIDPATGMPAVSGIDAVICAGPTAARAEGFAKSALVRGVEAGTDLLVAAGLTAWLVPTPATIGLSGEVRS